MLKKLALGASVIAASTAMSLGLSPGLMAAADNVSTATGAAYGVNLEGPVPIEAQPGVSAQVPGDTDSASDEILHVPADPLAESFTAHVVADASIKSTISALLQGTMDVAGEALPAKWNARGYAITEDLDALTDQLTADVIESESTAACVGSEIVYGSASRIVNLSVAGTAVPVLNPTPNQVVFDQAGIRIVFWETNWDAAAGAPSDGSDTVWTNALHVTAPGGIDLIVSHSEATARCATGPKNDGKGPKPDKLPKADCFDQKDNDGDGKSDFPTDPGCLSRQDDDERDGSAPPAPTVVGRNPRFAG